jgi:long-subunit acyl-CoA synthetase (AMP-forming)
MSLRHTTQTCVRVGPVIINNVCARCRYLKMEKETAETMIEGGWLRSGDVATIDTDHDPNTAKASGFVRITGRIKELIITAGGENM